MNKREFLRRIALGSASFFILPSAATYQRIWKPLVSDGFVSFDVFDGTKWARMITRRSPLICPLPVAPSRIRVVFREGGKLRFMERSIIQTIEQIPLPNVPLSVGVKLGNGLFGLDKLAIGESSSIEKMLI